MAMAIISLFQLIDVDHQHSKLASHAPGTADLLVERRHKVTIICQTSEWITSGQPAQTMLGPLAFGDVANVALNYSIPVYLIDVADKLDRE